MTLLSKFLPFSPPSPPSSSSFTTAATVTSIVAITAGVLWYVRRSDVNMPHVDSVPLLGSVPFMDPDNNVQFLMETGKKLGPVFDFYIGSQSVDSLFIYFSVSLSIYLFIYLFVYLLSYMAYICMLTSVGSHRISSLPFIHLTKN